MNNSKDFDTDTSFLLPRPKTAGQNSFVKSIKNISKPRNFIAQAWGWDEQIVLTSWPDKDLPIRIGIAGTLPNGQIWLQENSSMAVPVHIKQLQHKLGLMHVFWDNRKPWVRFILQHFDAEHSWSMLQAWAVCHGLLISQTTAHRNTAVQKAIQETAQTAQMDIHAISQNKTTLKKLQDEFQKYHNKTEKIQQAWDTLGSQFSELRKPDLET